MRVRTPAAVVYGAVVLGALALGPFVFALLVGVLALVAYYELWRLFAARAGGPALAGGLVLVVAYQLVHLVLGSHEIIAVGPYSYSPATAITVWPLLTWAMLIGLVAVVVRGGGAPRLLAFATTLAGATYVGWLAGYLTDLAFAGGAFAATTSALALVVWPLLAIAPTWAADVVAYWVGSTFGRRTLAPAISPGKTVEGTLAGVIAAFAVALIIGLFAGLTIGAALLAAVVVGPAGLAGDLAESAIKRAAGAKDSGTSLPGHGGVLDRIDSLLFAGPAIAGVLALAGLT